MKVNRDLSRDI